MYLLTFTSAVVNEQKSHPKIQCLRTFDYKNSIVYTIASFKKVIIKI